MIPFTFWTSSASHPAVSRPPDFGNLSRWWSPDTGFDGSSNWVDQINSDTMVGTASLATGFGNNAKAAIHCAGGTGLATSTTFIPSMSIYYVAQPLSTPERILSASVNNWLLGWWGGRQEEFYFEGWLVPGGDPNAMPFSDGNPHIYGMTTDGGADSDSAVAYQDGSGIVQGDTGVAAPNGLSIGTGGHFTEEWTECYCGDILVYSVVHDNATATAVMNWLNAKYGVY